MYRWVTVNLACASLKYSRLKPLRKTQHVNSTMHARFGGLHGIMLVVDWTCGTGQIVDLVYLDIQRKRDVVADELKTRMCEPVLNVALGTCKKVIEADNLITSLEQAIDEVRSQKTSATGNEYAHL